MRTALQLFITVTLVYLVWNVGPIYVNHRQFREELLATARKGLGLPESVLRSQAVALAASHDIPLAAEGVQIRRGPNRTYIDTSYTLDLPLFPTFTYPWTFDTTVDGLVVRPPVLSDYTP